MPVGRRDRLTFRGNVRQGRHGWLRLTPAYSLHVVHDILAGRAIDKPRVLEPFSGTGTTALVAAELGLYCDAIDINPFLVWLGNLKTQEFTESCILAYQAIADEVARRVENARRDLMRWTPAISNIHKWWSADVLQALAELLHQIQHTDMRETERDLAKVAYCRVMIESAKVSFGHQSMSFRRDRPNAQK